MERYRLKNIILLILALTNVFLLSSLLFRHAQKSLSQEQAKAQLTVLFQSEKYGLELLVDRIPDETPSSALNLSRDSKEERRLAAFLLGPELTYESRGGGTVRYVNDAGTASFRVGGEFDVLLSGSAPIDDPENYCIRFFRKFSYREPVIDLRDGTGTITAVQYFDKHPVNKCTVAFSFSSGVLQRVSGQHLPDNYTAAESRDCISARTALTAFLRYYLENDVVCHAVTDVDLSFELQSTPAAPLSLTPVWRLTTDTAQQFYVNAVTGEVSQ